MSGKSDWTGALDPEILTLLAIKCMQAAGHTAQFVEEEVVPVAQEHAGKILFAGCSAAAIVLAKNIASKSSSKTIALMVNK